VPTELTWDPITTALLALMAWLLRTTIKELIEKVKQHDEVLKHTVTVEICKDMQAECDNCPGWDNFRKHYHTGNGPSSGVVVR